MISTTGAEASTPGATSVIESIPSHDTNSNITKRLSVYIKIFFMLIISLN